MTVRVASGGKLAASHSSISQVGRGNNQFNEHRQFQTNFRQRQCIKPKIHIKLKVY